MEEALVKLKARFPTLPKDVIKKIYKRRVARLKGFMVLGIPEDIRWIIEAKVRLEGEFHESLVGRMPGMGRSSYSKKRRAKRMGVCHKCARWNCNKSCRNPGMVSINREDKIRFIKDGLSKESLDNIVQTLETHPSGDVHRVLLALADLFFRKRDHYNLGNLTTQDPVCQFMRKLEKK